MAGEEQRPQTQSLQVARSLWRTVVGSGAAPTVSLRAERAPAAASVVSRVTPRTRSLREPDAARDAAPDSDFNLLRRLGEGGMGVVYAAEQLALAREIAIKRIRPEEAGGSDAAAKFLAEAIVTGALDHPNVVPIYDIGRAADGSLFYAMKEVTGTCWADALREKPIEENLRILLAVCDAVAFAHDKGVIHRDLKPDNVMLGAYGEVVVMDWGLAASVGSDKAEPLTREAGLAGTPAYMAPEMALCAVEHIGKASDIYLLGGILYELTTGRRPHAGEDVYACIAAAMDNIIQPTTQSGELVEIARRAMATEPGERYASVQEFQQAIRGYLSHMESLRLSAAADARLLVLAKVDEDDLYREATEIIAGQQQALELWPSNHQAALGLRRARETMAGLALERGDLTLAKSQVAAMEAEQGQFALNAVDLVPIEVLSARISTALAAAAARERLVRLSTWAAVLAGLAALSLTSGAYWVTRQERDRALAAERLAVVERDRALTAEAREGGLRRVAEDALQTANRENYYNALALGERKIAEAAVRQAEAALWSTPPELRAWEWGLLLSLCHRDLVVLEGHSEALLAAAFAPAGDRVLTAGHDNLILVWDLATRGKVATLHTEAVPIVAAVFSGDGKRVLALTRDGGLRAWDLKTMQEQRRPLLPAAAAGSTALALSPDGMYAGAAEPGRIRVWDTETGQERVPLPSADSQAVQALAFSPLGRWIAALHRGGAISLCSLKDPAERLNLKPPPHAPGGSWIALSPDGQGVAVPGAGNTVLILHARRGEVLATLRGHAEPAVGAAFSQDGRWIVTAGRDKTARLWDARSGSEHLLLAGHSAGLLAAGLTPEADRALTAGEDSVARVWDARTAEALLTFRAQAAGIAAALLAADGKRAYLATADGMVKVWDTQLGRELETYSCGEAPPSALALSPDGRHLLCAGRTSVHVRSAQTGENQKTWLHDVEGIRTATFSPDGTRVALGGREASLWDARDGRKLADLTGHSGQVSCAVFAPDGQALLTGDRGGATLWDVPAGTVRMRLGGRATAVSAAAFSPDGKRILTGGQRMLRVWDAAGGRELLALEAHKSWIGCLSFCADGRHVITGADDGQGKIWFSFDPATTAAGIEERKAVLYRERAERR